MAKENLETELTLNIAETQDNESKETKDESSKADPKQREERSERDKITSLEGFKDSLTPQEKKKLETFMQSSVYDSFMSYLEMFFREKDTLIHRINCYCFRALENFSLRIQGKIYEIKKGQIIYIQKDSFGNSLLRNNKLERIM